MTYNTQRLPVILREYGRNIQKLVSHLSTINDRAIRTNLARKMIHLMKEINPTTNKHESDQRFWDHLMIMTEYKLDIDFPKDIEPCKPKPRTLVQRMPYKSSSIGLRQYGMNVDLLAKEALKLQDKVAQERAFIKIGRLLKYFYLIWNKDAHIEDKTIINQVLKISNGEVNLTQALQNNPKIFQLSVSNGKDKRRKR